MEVTSAIILFVTIRLVACLLQYHSLTEQSYSPLYSFALSVSLFVLFHSTLNTRPFQYINLNEVVTLASIHLIFPGHFHTCSLYFLSRYERSLLLIGTFF